MRVEKTLLGQSIRFIDDVREAKKPSSLYEVTRAIQDRYRFLEAPTKLSDYNYQNGVTFQAGHFKSSIIGRFQIYQLGLLCEGSISTDVCDEFFDDITTFMEDEFGQRGKEKIEKRIYQSNLEVNSEINLGLAFKTLSGIGQKFFEILKSYGYDPTMYEMSSLKFNTDATQIAGSSSPGEFIFERRAEKPYFANIYFSAAPLRTSDHIAILQELEVALNKGA